MALIKCPECGKEISDTAHTCPNCGFEVRNIISSKSPISGFEKDSGTTHALENNRYLVIAIISLVVFVVAWYYKASHGVAIASAEVDYAAVRYVSTTMIIGRICTIIEPISIISAIIFGILAFLRRK